MSLTAFSLLLMVILGVFEARESSMEQGRIRSANYREDA